ncbi:MAG: hypothetical protein U5O39_08100 [Gammaproteobacteria bacterium]|nr:hypothetical protein [Gammaproteobacteria bacterium]
MVVARRHAGQCSDVSGRGIDEPGPSTCARRARWMPKRPDDKLNPVVAGASGQPVAGPWARISTCSPDASDMGRVLAAMLPHRDDVDRQAPADGEASIMRCGSTCEFCITDWLVYIEGNDDRRGGPRIRPRQFLFAETDHLLASHAAQEGLMRVREEVAGSVPYASESTAE